MVDSYLEEITNFRGVKDSHQRSYGLIEPDQGFVELMVDSFEVDTFAGQLSKSLQLRFEHDSWGDNVEGYNPFLNGDITGYEHVADIFLRSTSPSETEMIKDLYDHNNRLRNNLDNHGFARFMGNLIDPINLIPIPIAKGMGFIRGAKYGGASVGGVMGVAESARASMDPTNPWYEPYLAIGGGAIFGAAIGGGVGALRSPLNVHLAGEKYFEFWDMADARTRVADRGEIDVGSIKPFVDRKGNEGIVSHLKKLIEKSSQESNAEYNKRIEILAKDADQYEDVMAASKLQDPLQFASAFGIEKQRHAQHPFFMLVNTKFKGDFGNRLRSIAFQIAGTPGMHVKASMAGAQGIPHGVVNKAQLHNKKFVDARKELYNAYRRSQGMKQKEELTPGQQVWESAWEVASFKYKALPEYMKKVNSAYLTWKYAGAKHSDPYINDGVEAMAKYYDAFAELGVKAEVFGVRRLRKDLTNYSRRIGQSQDWLRKWLDGDPTSKNPDWRLGQKGWLDINEGNLTAKMNKLEKLLLKGKKQDGLSKAEGALGEKLTKEIKELGEKVKKGRDEVAQVYSYLADPESFYKSVNTPQSGFLPQHRFSGAALPALGKVLLRHKQMAGTRNRLIEWGAFDPATGKFKDNVKLPNADKWARAHMPRKWQHEPVTQHREELESIIHDWYIHESGEFNPDQLLRIRKSEAETVDRILKIHKPELMKRAIQDAIDKSGLHVSEAYKAKMNKQIDELFSKKLTAKYTPQMQAQEMKILLSSVMKDVPFNDAVKAAVAKDMKVIEDMAAVGQPEGFGASTSSLERRLKIPSALLIKADGIGPSRATVDFIETNPELLMQNYHRRMSVSIEMANEFGDPTMKTFIDKLKLEMRDIVSNGQNPTERAALRLEADKMLQAISDLKEKALGIYKVPADPSSMGNKTVRSLKNWMVLALMGKATIAALADIGRGAMSVGLGQAFEMGFRRWGAASRDFRLAGQEVGEAGEAAEMALHGRFESMFDVEGFSMGSSAGTMEKFFQGGVQKMFVLNMLAPYTDVMKRFFGGMIQSNMLKTSVQWAGTVKPVKEVTYSWKGWKKIKHEETVLRGNRGTISETDMQALTKNGISFEDAVAIAEQFKKHGEMGDHLHLANTRAWDDEIIQKKFRTALVGEVNNAVITPNIAERLNFMSTPVGSLMVQFKAFALSATHRTLLAGLQQRDARAFHGILSMIVMGYFVDLAKSPTYDKRDLLSLDRFVQAVDYSGSTGILFDLNNMLEFLTAGEDSDFHIGIRPFLGVESFWKDPNLAQRTGQVGGPTASLFGDAFYSAFFSDEKSDAVRSLRRLIPFNNVIWWTFIIDRIQRSVSQDLDHPEEEE